MTRYILTHDIYTPLSIEAGVAAFAHLCQAASQHDDKYSILTISVGDHTIQAELLNYILALSAQDLLP